MTFKADDIRALHQPLHECQAPHAAINDVFRGLNTDPRVDAFQRSQYQRSVDEVAQAIARLRQHQLNLVAELAEMRAFRERFPSDDEQTGKAA